ncbi:amidophosphoribosyltransferase [Sinanaerobacter chloroacetimidivorans]|jgi:amidophosphoribosyltransferase|uniref:Amidophosphoribosyltransferase n=1 Tax=Sinanaerobacter chloroacetimidivorans TaxID=2818044 RepID=A0A8J8B2X3_9FIRM|nr:amidophosphoribosyltransferase [Sinanaerobacter chloroacetimidivorans]MBR0599167.1 amidophosphoribosyltransferase [Sinanaerobacter chloroacetimidivorans]
MQRQYDFNKELRELEEDKVFDECGVVGVYAPGKPDIARSVYYGLHSLQHRGQESAGIASNKGGKIQYYKEMGLVQEVFNDEIIERLQGDISIGHVRYSTCGESHAVNAMPLVVYHKGGSLALAHNGNLVNAMLLREEMQDRGVIFQTSIDSEIIAALIARYIRDNSIEDSIVKTLEQVKGAYALVITSGDKLIGVRDPNGIRPLCIGKTREGYILSSESCIFPLLGATFLRDVEPGEMIIIEDGELKSIRFQKGQKKAICAFEYVYLARPDSDMDGKSVYMARSQAGRILAKEHPVEADMVIAVPDSGTVAAIGYAEASGIPFGEGLIKNRYVGRTFIQPDQRMRELSVRLKLNVLKDSVKGKRIIMVDDSIVRGTTSGKIVTMLKDAGAKEVHVRVSSPPVTHSCHFGIDTPNSDKLVASRHTVEEIRQMIGADSLGYLSIEGLLEAIGIGKEKICVACFNGNYPMPLPDEIAKDKCMTEEREDY